MGEPDQPKRLYRCEACGLDVEREDATDPTSGYGLRPACETCRSCESHPETRAAYQRGLQDGRTELGRRLRSMGDDLMRKARLSVLFVTKADLRERIAQIRHDGKATGVPEDGMAEILAQWVVGHLERGTKVVRDVPLPLPTVVPSAPPLPAMLTPETPKPLTAAQVDELKRLAAKPQSTYGKHRTRVQNNLVWARLARFLDVDGREMRTCDELGMKNIADTCEITEAGRLALDRHLKANGRKRR